MRKIISACLSFFLLISICAPLSIHAQVIKIYNKYRLDKKLDLYKESNCSGCGIAPVMFANSNLYVTTHKELIIFDKNLNRIQTIKTDDYVNYAFFWKDYLIILYRVRNDSYKIIFYNKSSFIFIKEMDYPVFIKNAIINGDNLYFFYQKPVIDKSAYFPQNREINVDFFDLNRCEVIGNKIIKYEALNQSEINVNKYKLNAIPNRFYLNLSFYPAGETLLILDISFNMIRQMRGISISSAKNDTILGTLSNSEKGSYTFCRFDNNLEIIWQNRSLNGNKFIDRNTIYTKTGSYDALTGELIKLFDTNDPGYVGKYSRIINKFDDNFLLVNDGGYQTFWIVDMNMKVVQRFGLDISYSYKSDNDIIIGNDEEFYLLKKSNTFMNLTVDKIEYTADDETRNFMIAPYLYKDRLYVDLKSILESFGGQFYVHQIREKINGKEYQIYVYDMIFCPYQTIRIYPYKPIAKIVESSDVLKEILIDKDKSITPQFHKQIACIPLRFICNRFGLKLTWDQKTKKRRLRLRHSYSI